MRSGSGATSSRAGRRRPPLEERSRIPPRVQNRDGDELVFISERYDFDPAAQEEIQRRLAAMDAVVPPEAGDEDRDYIFHREGPATRPGLEDIVVGHVVVDGRSISLETNSVRRANALRSRVETALGNLIRQRRRRRRDAQRMVARMWEREPSRHGAAAASGAHSRDELADTPEAQQALREMKERHYADWPDQSLPALGDQTPRRAIRTKIGRERVDALLKDIEFREAVSGPANVSTLRSFAAPWPSESRRYRSAVAALDERVLDRHDDDAVIVLDEDVHDKHPAPRTEQEAEVSPPPGQLRPEAREPSERTSERLTRRFVSIGRLCVRISRSRSATAAVSASHEARTTAVEIDSAAGSRLLQPKLRPFERAGDPIEQCGDVPRVRARVVQRLGKQRTREAPSLMWVRSASARARRALRIERDVEPTGAACAMSPHRTRAHTSRVHLGKRRHCGCSNQA